MRMRNLFVVLNSDIFIILVGISQWFRKLGIGIKSRLL